MATESSHHLSIIDAIAYDRRTAAEILKSSPRSHSGDTEEMLLVLAIGAERRAEEQREAQRAEIRYSRKWGRASHDRDVTIHLDGETLAAAAARASGPTPKIDADEPLTLTDLGVCTMHIRGADVVIAKAMENERKLAELMIPGRAPPSMSASGKSLSRLERLALTFAPDVEATTIDRIMKAAWPISSGESPPDRNLFSKACFDLANRNLLIRTGDESGTENGPIRYRRSIQGLHIVRDAVAAIGTEYDR